MSIEPSLPLTVRTLLFAVAIGSSVHVLQAAEEPVVKMVYESDFSKEVDAESWSKTETLKVGEDIILVPGWYAKFSQRELPEHQFIRARVELVILGTFDGTDPEEGPDNWSLLVEGGTLLFLTNFRNAPVGDGRGVAGGIGQSFPDEFPAGLHRSGTGATRVKREKGALESEYELEILFPHREEDLVLQFQEGMRKHGRPRTENWGIRSLSLEVISGPAPRSNEELTELWNALVGKNPIAANKAVWAFLAAGAKGVEYVRASGAKLDEEEAEGAGGALAELKAEVEELTKLLDSEVFAVREVALKDLTKLPREAIPLLEAKLKDEQSPEVQIGIKGALRVIRDRPPAAGLARERILVRSRIAHVLRIHDTLATGRKIVASEPLAPVASLDDGYIPEVLGPHTIPRFDWWGAKDGKEGWVQYEFPKPRTIDWAEVFWFENTEWDEGAKLPKSWTLSYREGGKWKAVKLRGEYGITAGKIDRVEFEPVKTSALRLTAVSNQNSIGLVEFRVGKKNE